MLQEPIKRLLSHRRPLAAVALVAVAALGLVSARAAGVIGDPTAPTAGSPAPTVSAAGPSGSPAAAPAADGPNGGGAKNIVQVLNRSDGVLKTGGQVKLDPVNSPTAAPTNLALAYGSCTQCDTFAVALQVNLIGPNASTIAPQNAASAVNYMCTRCTTIAVAYQYNIQVSDPSQTPPRVHQLVAAMDQEIHNLPSGSLADAPAAESRIVAVINQFQDLAAYLIVSRNQSTALTDPGATPAPSPSAGATATPGAGSSPAPSGSAQSTPAPSPGGGSAPASPSPSASP